VTDELRLIRPETSVSHSSVIVSAGLFLTALLGAGQALLLVFIVGEGNDTDAFLAAYSLYVVFAIFGGSLRASIVPLLGAVDSDSTLRERASEIGSRVLMMGVVAMVGLAAVSPLLGQLMTTGLPSGDRWTAVLALVVLAPAAFLQIEAAALSAVLTAARRFVFSSSLYVGAGALALACSAALLELMGVIGAGLGLLVGALALAGGHAVYLHRFGVRLRPRLSLGKDRRQGELAVLLVAAAALGIALQVNLAISLSALSGDTGVITVYSYAYFFVGMLLTISALPLGLVTMPDLIQSIARDGSAAVREYLSRMAPYAFAVLAPLLFAYAADGRPLVEAIFSNSLSDESIDLLFELGLVLGLLTIPGTLLYLGSNLTLALGRSRRFLAVSVVAVVIQAAIVLPLSGLGATEVAFGHVASITIMSALVLRAAFGSGWAQLGLAALRRSLPAFLLASVFFAFRLPLGSDPPVLAAVAAGLAGLIAYVALGRLLWPSVATAFVDLLRRA
jgi:peptidoglycan biosynthesis protein MviN/MurJ (putative lipid II flippase)